MTVYNKSKMLYGIKSLVTHMQSEDHLRQATKFDTTQPSLTEVKKKMTDQERASYVAALRSVYYLAVEDLPNSKHKSLLNLQRVQGCHNIQQLKRGQNSTKESTWSHSQLLAALNEASISI